MGLSEGYIRKYINDSDYLTIDVVKHKFERFLIYTFIYDSKNNKSIW